MTKKVVLLTAMVMSITLSASAQKAAGAQPTNQPGLFRTVVSDVKAVEHAVKHGVHTVGKQLKRIFY